MADSTASAVSKRPRSFSGVLRLLGIVYAFTGLSFLFFPNEVFYLINVGPQVFGFGEPIPDSVERFWIVLTTAMMAMLTLTAFLSAQYPGIRGYWLIHLLSKSVSTVCFVYMFIAHAPFFAYLVGVVTDGALAVLVLYMFARQPKESQIAPAPSLGSATTPGGVK